MAKRIKRKTEKQLNKERFLQPTGKTIEVFVPKKKVERFKRVSQQDKRGRTKNLWLVDFRGLDLLVKYLGEEGAKQSDDLSWFVGKQTGNKSMLDSPQQLETAIERYFESCFQYVLDKDGKIRYYPDGTPMKRQVRPFTITGLAASLGTSRFTLSEYGRGKYDNEYPYSHLIRAAKMKIEQYAEERLYDKDGYNGAKFVLDGGFGWKTQKEQAEIEKLRIEAIIRQKEFELKKQLTQLGQEDSNFEIRIVRKSND